MERQKLFMARAIALAGNQSALAALLGDNWKQHKVSQYKTGHALMPPVRCKQVEVCLNKKVRMTDVYPELA